MELPTRPIGWLPYKVLVSGAGRRFDREDLDRLLEEPGVR
jgi:hypothetical protein